MAEVVRSKTRALAIASVARSTILTATTHLGARRTLLLLLSCSTFRSWFAPNYSPSVLLGYRTISLILYPPMFSA